MSFPFKDSVDVDMFTGIGVSRFACFTAQYPALCPQRSGHLCVGFVEVICCPTGSTARKLNGADGRATNRTLGGGSSLALGILDVWVPTRPVLVAPGDVWDGSYELPFSTTVEGQLWQDKDNAWHGILPNSVKLISLDDLPGHPVIPAHDDVPEVPAATWLDVTDPATLAEGCLGPYYYAVSTKQWIDVIQSATGGGFTSNCGMSGRYAEGWPF